MDKLVLSSFLNKAIQTSNRRTVGTEFITEAIELFNDPNYRSEILSNIDIKKKDLIFTEKHLKKQLKISGKEHKALSIKITIITPELTSKKISQINNAFHLELSDKKKPKEPQVEVRYALTIHYGNGKVSNSQVIASYSEFFNFSSTALLANQVGFQLKEPDVTFKFSKLHGIQEKLLN